MKTPNFGRVGPIGIAVALIAALLVPSAGISKGKEPAAAPAIPKEALALGMKEAPAVVQALSLPCQVSEARKLGEDKKTKTHFYEVACGPGTMGFILQAPTGGQASAFSCIEANTPPAPGTPPTAPCLLPGNANPAALMGPMIKAAGGDCVPEQVRGVGQTKTNTYVEVSCQGGSGYVVIASVPFDVAKPAQANNCLLYDEAGTNIKCTLAEPAARLAVVDKYAAGANNGCVVKGRRFVGVAKDNSVYFEASCQDGKGYLYKTVGGALATTYECAKATQLLGGCTLTDVRQAANEQAGLYTKLAQGAGSKCEVDRYALFPTRNPREEVVELVCKDGSSAILMSAAGQKSVLLDCGRAPVAGYKCSLGKDADGHASLTADLKRLQQGTTCVVSNSRVVGKIDNGNYYIEVACADKLKGYVLEYSPAPTVNPVAVVGCAFSGGTCKLPGNT